MRVLFVDDDKLISQSVQMALGGKGYAVDTADLGADALALIKDTSYDFVVVDVGLPDMDGYHIVRRMKIDQIETPVIMQTGLAGQDLIEDAETLGVQGILAKPFSIHELLTCMESITAASDEFEEGTASDIGSADPPRDAAPPERSPEPETAPVSQTGEQPATTPDQDRSPQRTPASGRALRQALLSGVEPVLDGGPKVRPAPASRVDPGSRPAPRPATKPNPVPATDPEEPLPMTEATATTPKLPAAESVTPAVLPQGTSSGDDDDRRNSERRPTIEAALITEDGELMACVILDLSEGGAQVKLAQPDLPCPKSFTLRQLDGPERRCEVRWRSGANIGLRFI